MTTLSRPASASSRSRTRLDTLLVERGLADSREKAQALIMAGAVSVAGRQARKAAEHVERDAPVDVAVMDSFVSRGGHKLEHALDRFNISAQDRVCLDVGASTGGFTDVLLRRGARRVYAVDVGRGQLDWRLRGDPRVVVRERTNIRYLESLPEPIDLAVVAVSFTSLRLALPPIRTLARPGAPILALVKPQFEAGRGQVGRGGVVRDPAVHRRVLLDIWSWCAEHGIRPRGLIASPIRGPAGNVEFLLWLENGGSGGEERGMTDEDVATLVERAIAEAPRRAGADDPPGAVNANPEAPRSSRPSSDHPADQS